MPKTPSITATTRERTGSRYAQRLRKQGRLPAVIYGHRTDPVSISVDEKEMLTHLKHGTHVLSLNVEGGSKETCLVKELQFGYLGDNVIHVDFARVDLDEEVHVHVHLNFVGEPASARKTGAILSHDLTELEVICRVNEIPDEIKVDLNLMGEATVLTVSEVPLPPGLRATTNPSTPVAHISFVHKEEAVGEEVEVVPGAEEPEVITDVKSDEAEPGKGETPA